MRNSTAIIIGSFVVMCGAAFGQDSRQLPPADRFERFFTVPGIEFSAEQQAKVAELRQEFSPKLAENQDRWDRIITQEQLQARREAFRQA